MIDLENIRSFTIPRPDKWNIFGASEFDAMPETHKDQIIFLNKEASKFIIDFSHNAGLITDGFWNPFAKGNFKQVDTYDGIFWSDDESKQYLKKWLYKRGIAFSDWVFVISELYDPVMLMTWKMLIKYSNDILGNQDVMSFDKTLNWCLVYFHEDEMFFGRDNVYDNTEDLEKMKALNERKNNFPKFRHPYL